MPSYSKISLSPRRWEIETPHVGVEDMVCSHPLSNCSESQVQNGLQKLLVQELNLLAQQLRELAALPEDTS